MKLFINSIKKTSPLIIFFSLLFITTSDAVEPIPSDTPDEALTEAHEITIALGFKYIGLKLITPYSEESVDICLEALKNKFLFVKMRGHWCLEEIVDQWDVPASTLDEKIYPAIKALPEKKFKLLDIPFTLWIIQFKQLPSEEERLSFLRSVLMDLPPGESPRKWGGRYISRSVIYLTRMASNEAKAVLQETLELNQKKSTGEKLAADYIEHIRVSIDEIGLRQRLDILGDPAQQVAELKSYLLKHRKIGKRITEEEIKKKGTKRISSIGLYHNVVWPIQQLGLMDESLAIDALKELWSDPAFALNQRQWAQLILLKLKQIDPEEAVVPMPSR